MIDRETAIYTLHELEDSDILNDELVQKLADIRTAGTSGARQMMIT